MLSHVRCTGVCLTNCCISYEALDSPLIWFADVSYFPTNLARALRLDRLHTNEGRKISDVPVAVVGPKQFDVPRLVKLPVVLRFGGLLNCGEHQVGEKPCGAPISVRERMDPDGLRVRNDS